MQSDELSYLDGFAQRHRLEIKAIGLSVADHNWLESAVEGSRDGGRCQEKDTTTVDQELIRKLRAIKLRNKLSELGVKQKINMDTIKIADIDFIEKAIALFLRAKIHEPNNGIEAFGGIAEAVISVANNSLKG